MSAADIWRTLVKIPLADSGGLFLADCPRVDGGSDRIRSDLSRTLADFLCPHKVRLSPPESAEKRSSADTGADSGGQWRTQADPIGSAADSGGQLSASFSADETKFDCAACAFCEWDILDFTSNIHVRAFRFDFR